MAVSAQLRCFVASAFDKPDVDAIYDNAVIPVLHTLGVKVLRVDRVEHNDDIDDKILALIRLADFCLADLTYARPSVYYEAGFVAGLGKPVVFIARRDHFRGHPDDHAGNLRVHFDLQMKNIIGWSGPDRKFQSRLRKRLRHILPGLRRRAKPAPALDGEQAEFSRLSLVEQLHLLTQKGRQLFYSRGFGQRRQGADSFSIYSRTERKAALRSELEKVVSKKLIRVKLVSQPAFSKSAYHSHSFLHRSLSEDEKRTVRTESAVLVYASLKPVRQSVLKTTFANHKPLADGIFERSTPPFRLSDTHPVREYIVVLDAVTSVSDFSQQLRTKLSALGLE